MLGHTRKHRTKNIGVKIHEEENELIDWREAFTGLFEKYSEAGVTLRGFRLRDELTQKQVAEKLGIEQGNVSMMEKGKRPIGKEMAKRLAKLFHTDYRCFL